MHDLMAMLDGPKATAAMQTAALLLPRILPLVVFTPMLGGSVLPARLRIGISLLLVAIFMPTLTPPAPVELASGEFLALIVKEALIGLTLATIVMIMYHTITSFGALVDLARGATIASVFDPFSKQQQSLLGAFFLQVAVVLFLTLGGHLVIIEALGQSLISMPLYELAPVDLTGAAMTTGMIGLLTKLFVVAIQLTAPVLLVVVLLDVVLGLLNRVAPQIQVYFLGLTIKPALGVLIVFTGLIVSFDLFRGFFADVLRTWLPMVLG